MSRNARLLLLSALCVGVFLVGVELLVTAVALPFILADLADWTRLREASWIINGYLVAFVAVMPLAGRAADRYSLPTLFSVSLVIFAIGSIAAGAAQSLEWLIAARVVQGLGAGAIVPLATAGASHLFEGHNRARALGVVGALTFLGMAAGPFIGAAILQGVQLTEPPLIAPAWRWIFYLGAPLALLAAIYTWAAAPAWPRAGAGAAGDTAATDGLDLVGGVLFTTAVTAGLVAVTIVGEGDPLIVAALALTCLISLGLALIRFATARSPFIDLRFFADRTFSGAVLLSLLTGYGLATAIIGGAVFIDRVRYAGPSEQQLALGGLALSMAIGALGSGFVLRRTGVVVLSLVGLALSIGGLLWLSTATVDVATSDACRRPVRLRLRLRPDRHREIDRRGRGPRQERIRGRVCGRNSGADAGHGRWPRRADRSRFEPDRGSERCPRGSTGTRRRSPARSPGPAAGGLPRGQRAGGVGRERSRNHPLDSFPRRCGRDGRRDYPYARDAQPALRPTRSRTAR